MSAVISIQNLSKKYLLRHRQQERYESLRDLIAGQARSVFRKIRYPLSERRSEESQEEFWALKNVNLDIEQGDRIGIIGRNGAGKSTLLKILSRITEPTNGRLEIRGRVSSLLEVGTGFNPELTGRENIYLNGSILGMSKTEIRNKFDAIVAFAEVEKFLDTPVKRYSSGMYVRLAFAVAAHLEPDVLVVDEVLAVGDSMFQKKCLGKMEEVSDEGRTILFVSHNMNAVEQLCNRAVLLDQGRKVRDERDVPAVIKDYLHGGSLGESVSKWVDTEGKWHDPYFSPRQMRLIDSNGVDVTAAFGNNADVWVEIECEVRELDPALTVGYALFSEDGNLLYWSYHTDGPEDRWPRIQKGVNRLRSKLPRRLLNEGAYRLEMMASLHFRAWLLQPGVNAPSFNFVIQGGLSDSPYWMGKRPGIMAPVFDWESIQ